MLRAMLLAGLLASAGALAADMPEGASPAILQPLVDGKPVGEAALFWSHEGEWFAEASTWAALGAKLAPGTAGPVSAADASMGMSVDENAATVALTLPIDTSTTRLLSRQTRQEAPLAEAAPGMLANYSIAARANSDRQAISLGHELRTAGRWGVFSTSGQFNVDSERGGEYRRGVTRWQRDDLARQITYQAGDVFATTRSGSVNLGGVRIAKDPGALDPLTPTYPVPFLGGIALDPSSVEVLANQARVLNADVERGQFRVEGNVLSPGANQTQVVVRDRFGRASVLSDARVYVSPTLLRQGLSTWDVALGQVRQDENTYGPTGATANVAMGVSDRWTLRGSAQADELGQANATIGAVAALGTWGTFDVDVGQSTGGGQRWAVGYNYQGPRFGVRLDHEQNEDYWRLSSSTSPQALERTRASAFYRHSRTLSVRAAYTDLVFRQSRVSFADFGLQWRRGPSHVTATVLRDFDRHETRFELGYAYSFDRGRVSASARVSPDQEHFALRARSRVDVAGTPVHVGLDLEDGTLGQRARASADWITSAGFARAEVDHRFGATDASASFSGAVHIDRGGVSFLQPAEAFVVVDVPGQADVPVRVQGRIAGKTNARGRLVVGGISALAPVRVQVDERALPMGARIGEVEKTAMASRMSGMRMAFPLLAHEARTFRLTGPSIEPGTTATTADESTLVGFDGVLYLDQPKPGMRVDVKGVCTATLPEDLGTAETIAPLQCQ